jgi:hypothetical protein
VSDPISVRSPHCKDGKRRRADCAETSFTFLGCTFRARNAPPRDGTSMFTGFLPAVSKDALKRMSEEVRSWRIHLRTATELQDLAAWINPVVREWMTYYGRYYRTALNRLLKRINAYLVRWAQRKYKRLRPFSNQNPRYLRYSNAVSALLWITVSPTHRRSPGRGSWLVLMARRPGADLT